MLKLEIFDFVEQEGVELELGMGDRLQTEQMWRRVGSSLLRWLGFGKPPQQRVRHKVWREFRTIILFNERTYNEIILWSCPKLLA